MITSRAFIMQSELAEMFGRVWKNGGLYSGDRRRLMLAILEENSLSSEEYATIDRLIHAVRRGWLQVLD